MLSRRLRNFVHVSVFGLNGQKITNRVNGIFKLSLNQFKVRDSSEEWHWRQVTILSEYHALHKICLGSLETAFKELICN